MYLLGPRPETRITRLRLVRLPRRLRRRSRLLRRLFLRRNILRVRLRLRLFMDLRVLGLDHIFLYNILRLPPMTLNGLNLFLNRIRSLPR